MGLGVAASRWGAAAFETVLQLKTGRTHQIRAQLAACGVPLLGDTLYGCWRESAVLASADAIGDTIDEEDEALPCINDPPVRTASNLLNTDRYCPLPLP